MEAWFEKNFFSPDLPFDLFTNEGNCPVLPHWHDEVEIVYMLKGSVAIGIDNKIYNLKPRDILIIGCGDIHFFSPSTDDSSRLVVRFNISVFDSAVPIPSDRKEIRRHLEYCKKSSGDWMPSTADETEKILTEMAEEYTLKNAGYKLALKSLLYQLMVILFRKIPLENKTNEEINKKKEVLKRLENIFQYVDKNYVSDISLKDCADAVGFSIYHFSRFFKQSTGITFNQFLSSYRVTRAEWLLMDEGQNITEIALSCGFNSVKTFDRVFKQLKGLSPSQFRKKQDLRTT